MEYNKIKALFYLAELTSLFDKISYIDKKQIMEDSIFQNFAQKCLKYMSTKDDVNRKKADQTQLFERKKKPLSDYDFELVMENIKNSLTHRKLSAEDDMQSIGWILQLLLKNTSLFPKVSELDIFLSNVSGLKHSTKSTGRDRIVDWYLTKINEKYPDKEINQIYYKILKYIFTTYSSDYKEWSKLLTNIKG